MYNNDTYLIWEAYVDHMTVHEEGLLDVPKAYLEAIKDGIKEYNAEVQEGSKKSALRLMSHIKDHLWADSIMNPDLKILRTLLFTGALGIAGAIGYIEGDKDLYSKALDKIFEPTGDTYMTRRDSAVSKDEVLGLIIQSIGHSVRRNTSLKDEHYLPLAGSEVLKSYDIWKERATGTTRTAPEWSMRGVGKVHLTSKESNQTLAMNIFLYKAPNGVTLGFFDQSSNQLKALKDISDDNYTVHSIMW
jgi:hypothetical protein